MKIEARYQILTALNANMHTTDIAEKECIYSRVVLVSIVQSARTSLVLTAYVYLNPLRAKSNQESVSISLKARKGAQTICSTLCAACT